jgi:ubiquinone/menaquinone biosynthesis C-methylase UbiE
MAQIGHPMLAQMTHDEGARDNFIFSLKRHVSSTVGPGNRNLYFGKVLPALEKKYGRPPKNRHEVRKAMEREPYYQSWSALMRVGQEMMWDSVGESVDRQVDGLIAKYKKRRNKLGTVRTDPDFKVPRYLTAVDHHGMPGSYHTETREDDVRAGAVYDRGAFLFQIGGAGGVLMDARGQAMAAYLRENHPDFKPKRILDLGCSVGMSTLVFCDAYPDAEIHAIDPGAPLIRYAHARAEHLNKKVHFSQQNAEFTDFEDESFDLVMSHVMVHETSGTAIRNIVRETHRLLKSGGMMAHLEVPVRYKDLDLCEQAMRDWQTYYNEEPFWGGACTLDLCAVSEEFGFHDAEDGYQQQPRERFGPSSGFTQKANSSGGWWYVMSAVK